MSEYDQVITTDLVFGVILAEHFSILKESKSSGCDYWFAPTCGDEGVEKVEYTLPEATCPLMGMTKTWKINKQLKKSNEKTEYYLCIPRPEWDESY